MRNIKYLISLFLITPIVVNADSVNMNRYNGALAIESAFINKNADTITIATSPTQVAWSNLDVSISNQWKLTLKSKSDYNIQKISLTIDNTTLTNNVNLQLKPNTAATYFFYDIKLDPIIKQIATGYNVIGVYQSINGNDFASYDDLRYKKVKLTVSWIDKAKNYNQASTNFMLVMAR